MSDDPKRRARLEAVVAALDVDGNGMMDSAEVKVFVSRLTGVPPAEIADDHPEVLKLAGKTSEEMVEYMLMNTEDALIDSWYQHCIADLADSRTGC